MPRGREPVGAIALSNAERQARYRARQLTLQTPPARPARAAARRSRSQRWNDALAELLAVQAECAAWFEALPESLRDSPSAEALHAMIDLDLEALAAVQPPRGYGRD